jgi:hypothetical protein
MVIKKIWVPPYGNCGNQNFLVATKGWLVASFLKAFINGFSKTCGMSSFLGTKKFSRH